MLHFPTGSFGLFQGIPTAAPGLLRFAFLLCVHNRVLESHFQSQKEDYEKEIEGLNSQVEHLTQEINHVQKLFREENAMNGSIQLQLARLTLENRVRTNYWRI